MASRVSSLNGRARPPLAMSAARREPSSTPSSRSNRHSRTCRAMQHAHQPFGETGDDRADGTELGFEPRSERCELVTAGQRCRVHDAVVRGRVRAISARAWTSRAGVASRSAFAVLISIARLLAERRRRGARIAAPGKMPHDLACRKWQAAWFGWVTPDSPEARRPRTWPMPRPPGRSASDRGGWRAAPSTRSAVARAVPL